MFLLRNIGRTAARPINRSVPFPLFPFPLAKLHRTSAVLQLYTVQTTGSLKTFGLFRDARAGIAVYLGPNDTANTALPLLDVSSSTSVTEVKEKAIMLGILVGMRKCQDALDRVLVVSDCQEAVEKLRQKFASPKLELRVVPRKHVAKAARLARKASKMERIIFDGT